MIRKPAKILTPKMKNFADNLMETENQRLSASRAYDISDPFKASAKATNLMQKDVVREYIQANAAGAMSRIVKLSMKAKNLNVKLAANKDIMDRAGYKPQEAAVNINIPIYLPSDIMDKYIDTSAHQPLPPTPEPEVIDIPTND